MNVRVIREISPGDAGLPDVQRFFQFAGNASNQSELLKRIRRRARSIETGITSDYLSLLGSFYDEWMQTFDLCPVLSIRTENLDFVHKPKHLNIVTRRILDKLSGKEDIVFPPNPNPI